VGASNWFEIWGGRGSGFEIWGDLCPGGYLNPLPLSSPHTDQSTSSKQLQHQLTPKLIGQCLISRNHFLIEYCRPIHFTIQCLIKVILIAGSQPEKLEGWSLGISIDLRRNFYVFITGKDSVRGLSREPPYIRPCFTR